MGTFAMIIALIMVAIIVDSGNAWAHFRITQNGTDASAETGATILSERAARKAPPAIGWDATVANAVSAMAAANGITIPKAYYTDVCGNVLTLSDTVARADFGDANIAIVGGGSLPVDSTTICTSNLSPGQPGGPVAGVRAFGSQTFATFIAGVINITSLKTNATATAVTGQLSVVCAADTGEYCVILPIAVWYNKDECIAPNGNWQDDHTAWPLDPIESILPLCSNGPGNVGWISWTNNINEGISGVVYSITNPDNPAITLPVWLTAGTSGNSNSQDLEDAINAYTGQTVLIPTYDVACGAGSGYPSPATGTYPYNCADLNFNGNGVYYHVPQFAAFKIDHAYMNGNGSAACGGNGSTNCLTGWFESYLGTGNIGPGSGTTGTVAGVQLIK